MKQIFIVVAVLSVLAVATVGCMYIFDVLSYEDSVSGLIKVVAAIALLGICSALVSILVRSGKEPPT